MADSVYLVVTPGGDAFLAETTDSTLADIQTLVDGHIECVALPGQVDAWINEDGLDRDDLGYNLLGTYMVRGWTGNPGYHLVGPVVFAAHDDEGNTLPCPAGFIADTVQKGVELTPRFQSDNALLLVHTIEEIKARMDEEKETA
jgi:hypothetical protein